MLGYFDVKASKRDARKLTRVLTERAKARSIAVSAYFSCSHSSINCYLTTSRLEARVRLYSIDLMTFKISLRSLRRADSSYLPLSLESLIEEDLEKLEYAKRGSVDDGGNKEHKQDQDKDQDKDKDKDDGEGNGDKPENKEGDSVNGDTEQPSTGSDAEEDEGPKDSENENADPITLGVRIYTQRGAVVSVTGQVTCEENDEQDKNVKEKNKDKEEDPTASPEGCRDETRPC